MVELKKISYEDERLGFFADQRKLVQKRYDRLEKQIKPDEPYTSERREFLSDLGRELSFYNDVIEMLENGVVPKSELDEANEVIDMFQDVVGNYRKSVEELQVKLEQTEDKVTREIFKKIDEITLKYLDDKEYSTGDMVYDLDKLKEKYTK